MQGRILHPRRPSYPHLGKSHKEEMVQRAKRKIQESTDGLRRGEGATTARNRSKK
jgi:hypothetical protein